MPVDPDKYKQDSRSPQELAKAILDHELNPRSPDNHSLSFREKLCCDHGTREQERHPVLRGYGSGLLWAMKSLEDDSPLDREERFHLRHALLVIDAYRQKSEIERDRIAKSANAPLAHPPHSAEDHRMAEFRREIADEMGDYIVQISNLNSIEKLIHPLAHKIGIPLIEPNRRQSGGR